MKFTVLELSDDMKFMSVRIKDIPLCYVNGCRRTVLADIPTVALDFDATSSHNQDVIIKKNTGILHNEFLVDRIALVPIHFTAEEIASYEKGRYVFKLEKTNMTRERIPVTSRDIEVYVGGKKDVVLSHRLFPVNKITNDPIIITYLNPSTAATDSEGDSIDIEFVPSVGTARMHAKWCAVSTCTYFNTLTDSAKSERDFLKDDQGNPNSFDFTVQSECGLTAPYIIEKAFTIMYEKLDQFDVHAFKTKVIKGDFTEIELDNVSLTLVNLIHSRVFDLAFRQKAEPFHGKIRYIGYYQIHPLSHTIILKFNGELGLINDACKIISSELKNIAKAFMDSSGIDRVVLKKTRKNVK